MKNLFFIILSIVILLPQFSFSQGCIDAGDEEGVQVIGFIQPQFQYNLLGDDLNGKSLDESSFYFNRARLGVVGSIPYDFSYYFLMEFSPTLNGSKESRAPFLLDGFIAYNRFAPYVKFSIGQFKSPFGRELLTPCHELTTIHRSDVVRNLAHPWRDMGIMISGKSDSLNIGGWKTHNLFGYQLALMNGTGINQWDKDNMKEYVGRLTIHPLEFITVGASYRYGKSASIVEYSPDDIKKRFGVDVAVEYKGLSVEGEYIQGKDEGSYTKGGGCSGDVEIVQGTIERNGYYAQVAYMTPWHLQPVIRYESYDPNMDLTADDFTIGEDYIQNTVTYGINYFFNDKVRLQINYLYKVEESGRVKVEHNNDVILGQLQVVF